MSSRRARSARRRPRRRSAPATARPASTSTCRRTSRGSARSRSRRPSGSALAAVAAASVCCIRPLRTLRHQRARPAPAGRRAPYADGTSSGIALGLRALELEPDARARRDRATARRRAARRRRRTAAARSARGRGSTPDARAAASACAGCRWIDGPQCSDSGTLCARHSASTRSSSVIPPQRVTSAWSTSTAPASSIRSKYGSVVAVLAGGDRHPGRRAVAEQPQALEVVGGDRLLEPADVRPRREALGERRAPACASTRRWRRRTARAFGPIASRASRHALGIVAPGSSRPSSSPAGCPARPSRRAARAAARASTR